MRSQRHGWRLSAIVATIAGCLIAAATPAIASARTLLPVGMKIVFKPSSFVAGYGVGGGFMTFDHVRWTYWGQRSAIGRGTMTYNTCEPICAAGNYASAPARIRVYNVIRGCDAFPNYRGPMFSQITARPSGLPAWTSITAGTMTCS